MPNEKKPRHRERENTSRGANKAGRSGASRPGRPTSKGPLSTARPESPYASRPKPRADAPVEEKKDRPKKPERVRAYDNRPARPAAKDSSGERPQPERPRRERTERAERPRTPVSSTKRFDETRTHVSNARHGAPNSGARTAARSMARSGARAQEVSTFALKGPGAVIARRAADRLRAGHVWVYASDMEQVETGELPFLSVVDGRGIPMGTALYSASSQIALRLVTTEILTSHAQWLALLKERLHAAFARREAFASGPDTDALRLVFSEGDALPGLIIDKYGELIIVQLLTQGLDRQDTRDAIVEVLREKFDPATIVERPDPRIRELEQLAAPSLEPLFARDSEQPLLQTQFKMNGLLFHYDSSAGQKTGAFLDQSRNYAAAEQYARGDALDVCTYQGGFALHMARKCRKVTGVDVSRAGLEVAERNLDANRSQVAGEVEWIEANAFELLREWSDAGTQFDTVVLDPPAFAKTKRAAENAVRGYKEMTLRALKMIRPGGTLVTCSCSHHVSLAEFTQVVATAAVDAGRRVQLLERRGASPDHPHVLSIPETEYLKCLICRVD